jgi:hypothetical protein
MQTTEIVGTERSSGRVCSNSVLIPDPAKMVSALPDLPLLAASGVH